MPRARLTRLSDISSPGGNFALRFFGNGINDIDRVKILIDDVEDTTTASPPINIGSEDFTIEFWMRAATADNTAGAVTCGANNNWINGNIVIDRDRFGQGRNYGLSIAGGVFVFGVMDASSVARTICGTTNILDDEWHHVAVTRDESTGAMELFIDGESDATGTGPAGDISYPIDGIPSQGACDGPCDFSDPFIVLGAEKHDAGAQFPSYNGYMDELRFSNVIRYTETFSPPGRFSTDASTVGLYHFDEGEGTILVDSSGVSVPPLYGDQNGFLSVGGSPSGPVWVSSGAPTG